MSKKEIKIDKEEEEEESLSILNKKRGRKISEEESEEEISQKNKKKKIETKNYLTFSNNSNNLIHSKTEPFFINKKIITSSLNNNYNYSCQKIASGNNPIQTPIQIIDAKILFLDNKILFFLLSSDTFYIYEIKENKNYEFIKEIQLNSQNSFNFVNSPTVFFLITPEEKISRKNNSQKNNKTKKIKTKMLLYLCIISCTEKYLCELDLDNLIFNKVKNIMPKKKVAKFLNNDMKFKLYNKNRILSYNNKCAYRQKLYGAKKFKNLKQKNIERISLLSQNLICICTPEMVYVYEVNDETLLGEIKINGTNKKARLLKPDNNLLMVYSKDDISLYDLESLSFFQKLDLYNITNNDEPIKKAKQLNNNNIAILFSSVFVVYDLGKNAVTFKCDYWKNNYSDFNGMLMEVSPNVVLINNDENNFYLMNGIKGDKIASLNVDDTSFSLCKKVKKYQFKYGVSVDKNIEIDENNTPNYILLKNEQNSFILSSIAQESL